MSCFMVGRAHVAFLVEAALELRCLPGRSALRWYDGTRMHEANETTAARIGQMLLDANARSFCARYTQENLDDTLEQYGEHVIPPAPGGRVSLSSGFRPAWDFKPVDVLKAIGCFEYQACEHEAWSTSEAQAFCRALRHATIQRLPGFDAASWGAPEAWEDAYRRAFPSEVAP